MTIFTLVKKSWRSVRQWTWHHAVVFLTTFFSYAFFHACRKSFSNIKDTLDKSVSPQQNRSFPMYPLQTWEKEDMFDTSKDANVFLGELDLLFLLAYAIGLYISGIVGDRVNLRYLLSFGMCGSAILTFLFGYLSEVLHMREKIYYQALSFLNGLLQSTGWPATVAIMGNWFSKSSGGLVFGFWSGNASLGNIIGSIIVASTLNYGYEYGMLLNSILLFCGGVLVFFCLIVHPNDVGLQSPDKQDKTNKVEAVTEGSERVLDSVRVKKPKAIGFFQAVLIPGVIPYSLAYACLKLVNYAFFFWLPTYLSQGLHWHDDISDELSNFYDLGGIIGGIIAGIVTDIMGMRAPFLGLMLTLSMGSLAVYSNTSGDYKVNVALMALTGFLIGGPANTISTAITADLGKHEKIKENADALATVTGIIDGTGSVGAAIGQYLVGVINKKFGWQWVFYFLILMTGCSIICTLPMIVHEIAAFLRRCRKNGYKSVPEHSD